jgi:hypothetical protein
MRDPSELRVSDRSLTSSEITQLAMRGDDARDRKYVSRARETCVQSAPTIPREQRLMLKDHEGNHAWARKESKIA